MELIRSYDGHVRVKAERLAKREYTEEFLNKMFAMKGVNGVIINCCINTALIEYDPRIVSEEKLAEKLEKFDELKSSKDSLKIHLAGIRLSSLKNEKIAFKRRGDVISSWAVKSSLPGRVRLVNPFFYKRNALFKKIEEIASSVPGVDAVKTNPLTTSVLVTYDTAKLSDDKIIYILENEIRHLDKKDFIFDKSGPTSLAINSSILIPTCVASMLFPAFMPVSALIITYTAMPIFKKAWGAIKKKQIKVDILDSVVIGASMLTGHLVTGAFMVLILDFADYLQSKTAEKSSKQLQELFGKSPRFAWLVKDGVDVEVSVNDLKEGNIIVVNPGEHIPVDGTVYEGEGLVDQHALTGESAPVEKTINAEVFASTVVVGGKLFVKVKNVGKNTVEAKIKSIVLKACQFKPAVMNKGEKIADRMVLPTLAMGGIAALTRSPGAAMAVVNCDLGTGIRVAAPTAVLAYLALAARKGIIIKRGDVLEKMKDLDIVIFDKTGTLTHDIPEVDKIECYDAEKGQFLKFAASLEQKFTHPIAKAIVSHAKTSGIVLYSPEGVQMHIGYGVEANFENTLFKLGSLKYMQKEGIAIPDEVIEAAKLEQKDAYTVIFGAYNNRLAGKISLKSSIRSEAFEIIKRLKDNNIEPYLISGDNRHATEATAKILGIDKFYSEVLPEDKKNYVDMFKKQGKKVCMVGDGINDSAALAKADVSVSLSGGSAIAVDVADVVFMDGDLKKFNELFTLSQEAEKTLNRSFKMITIPNTICIVGAMLGIFSLGHSLVFNNFFNFMSTVNAALPMGRIEN